MTTRLNTKKEINILVILFTLTYMVSYITRINYGAIISEIEKSTEIARSILSIALTGSFITYGSGQIISGILGDRLSPKKLVSLGLAVTSLMNFLIPLCRSPYLMIIVWCINGFAQSFMWPPIVRLMTVLLSDDEYKKATAKVSFGSLFGTMAVYLISPLLISVSGWKTVFIFSGVSGIVMLAFWLRYSYEIESERKTAPKKSSYCNNSMIFTPVMIGVMIAIILQGMLRDGVTTWMPTYISDTYNLSNVISILTGVILPIFSILCIHITSDIYRKKFNDPVLFSGIIFSIGSASAIGLYFMTGVNVTLSVILSAVLTGCMHGVNFLLVCMIPAYFKKYGNVSTVSGIINSCTYIGSAISTYGIALVSEKLGWNFTIITWIIIGSLGALLSLGSAKRWKKLYSE